MPGDVSATALSPDYIVVGETQVHNDEFHVFVRILSTPNLKIEWSAKYVKRRETLEILEAQQEIARKIIETVGEANGVVPQLVRADRGSMSEVAFEDFRCVMGIFEYWDTFSPKVHQDQQICLEETVKRTPSFANAWAALSYIYMEAATQGYGAGEENELWAKAKEAADKALELAPLNDRGLSAAMSWAISNPEPDREAFREYGVRYVSLRPNNPDALAAFGFRLGVNAGEWDEAIVLMEKALALSDRSPDWLHFGPAYYAILREYPEAAWVAASKLTLRGSKAAHILRAIAAARTDRADKLKENLEALGSLGTDGVEAAVGYIKARRYEPKLREAMIEGVKDAYAKAGQG